LQKNSGLWRIHKQGATERGLRHAIITKARKIDPFNCDKGKLLDRLAGTFIPRSQGALMGREAAPITNITNL